MTFGLTPQGFNAERLSDLVNELNDAFVAQFGEINTSPQSVFGQIIGVMAKVYADLWENMNQVYGSQYPNSAFGVSLDNVVALNGITREPANQTTVIASCAGNADTLIPQGALATIPGTNNIFYATTGGTITTNVCDYAVVSVGTVTYQSYTITLNSVDYVFSLPTIVFTGSFVTGNSTVVYINGIALTAVPFNTNTATTIADIATEIATDPAIASATVISNIIYIVPNTGFSVVVNAVSITGGASQPTVALDFVAPANAAQISAGLTAILNANTPTWTATDLTGSLSIRTNSEETPFNISVGTNLSISSFTSPIQFSSQAYDAIVCPIGALTEIVTPISGWDSINNVAAGITGNLVETDAELRIRRYNSIRLLGLATVPSMTAHLINVTGVQSSSVQVIENVTAYENDMVITFSGAVTSGQTIGVTYNGGTLSVPFDTDMATTMADLAAAFETLVEVDTAVVSGSGSTILTLTFNVFYVLTIASNGVVVTGSGTLPTVLTTGGQPPKSVQVVLVGGTDAAVGLEIWNSKPAGIQTFGNTSTVIVDSQGNNQTIYFSRPVPIYIWITAALTLDPQETFPPNGVSLVANTLLNYGQTQIASGDTVFIQRLMAQVFNVTGIGSVSMMIASTISLTQTPSYGTSDISISNTQIATFGIQQISVAVA